MDLDEFGIHEGISEVIFTTLSPDGVPNAAPVGLYRKSGLFFIRIFRSRTLDNILNKPIAAANIIDDPYLFVQSALSDIEIEKFDFIEGFPYLKDSLGWIQFECNCKKKDHVSLVELIPIKSKILHRKIAPVNRGKNAVIEAAVHATRYCIQREQKYLEKIDYYNTIVQKCGSSRSKDAMKLLYELINAGDSHR